jgi:hypothetical protein
MSGPKPCAARSHERPEAMSGPKPCAARSHARPEAIRGTPRIYRHNLSPCPSSCPSLPPHPPRQHLQALGLGLRLGVLGRRPVLLQLHRLPPTTHTLTHRHAWQMRTRPPAFTSPALPLLRPRARVRCIRPRCIRRAASGPCAVAGVRSAARRHRAGGECDNPRPPRGLPHSARPSAAARPPPWIPHYPSVPFVPRPSRSSESLVRVPPPRRRLPPMAMVR